MHAAVPGVYVFSVEIKHEGEAKPKTGNNRGDGASEDNFHKHCSLNIFVCNEKAAFRLFGKNARYPTLKFGIFDFYIIRKTVEAMAIQNIESLSPSRVFATALEVHIFRELVINENWIKLEIYQKYEAPRSRYGRFFVLCFLQNDVGLNQK